jgi:hypothetical protein
MAAANTAERAARKPNPLLLLFMARSSFSALPWVSRWRHFEEGGLPKQTGFLNAD